MVEWKLTRENPKYSETKTSKFHCRQQIRHGLTWHWNPASAVTCDITLQEKVVSCHLVTTEASHCTARAIFASTLEQFGLLDLDVDVEIFSKTQPLLIVTANPDSKSLYLFKHNSRDVCGPKWLLLRSVLCHKCSLLKVLLTETLGTKISFGIYFFRYE